MLSLTFACAAYDRTRPLIDGRVGIDGVALKVSTLHPEESFARARSAEFDLTELSLSGYARSQDAGESAYVALPVFLSRAFRHSAIYIHTGKGILAPADLRGKTLGTPDYKTTANVWIRAFLGEDYGIQPQDVQWVEAPMEAGEAAAPGKDLSTLLARGEIDAVIGAKMPSSFHTAGGAVARLFPDCRRVEEDYYRRTRLFPIMHLLGLRRTLYEQHPWLAETLCRSFEAARRMAQRELGDVCQLAATLPWMAEEHRHTVSLMGEDYWPYGLDANRHVLHAFARYHFQQGLSRRLHDPAAWFAPSAPPFSNREP